MLRYFQNGKKSLNEVLPEPHLDTSFTNKNVPTFVICSCDLRTGSGFYFTQKSVGSTLKIRTAAEIKAQPNPLLETVPEIDMETSLLLSKQVSVADAVAASSAYPAAFEPLLINVPKVNSTPAYTISLTDGGVHDNIGTDPLFIENPNIVINGKNAQSHKIIFVSNASMPLTMEPNPSVISSLLRVIDVIIDQVTQVRVKDIIEKYSTHEIFGTLTEINDLLEGIFVDTKIKQNLRNQIPACLKTDQQTIDLIRNFRTDLNHFTKGEFGVLENVGYALFTFQFEAHCKEFLWDLYDENRVLGLNFDTPFVWPKPEYTTKPVIDKELKDSDGIFTADVKRPITSLIVH